MSVQNLAVLDELTRTLLSGQHRCRCFYCRRTVKDVAVVWQGQGEGPSAIILHPNCAQALATRLLTDGFTASRILGGKPLLGGIDKSLIPAGEA